MKNLFKTEKHFNRYLYAKKKAEIVNEYLESDLFLVFDLEDNSLVRGKFVFKTDQNPIAGLSLGNCIFGFIGYEWDNEGNIYVCSKKDIDKYFNNFYIFNKKDKIKIKFA